MTKPLRLRLHVTDPAKRDIAAIANWSLREFGEAAAVRYRKLILQALLDIVSDPERPGSKERPEFMVNGVRTYHLAFSRSKVPGRNVKAPRHFLLYRRQGEVLEVARGLHDARDLDRYLPDDYRRAGQS